MPDESARARKRWVVVNVRAFGVAQIAPSERERERHSSIGKREFEPGVPWPAPPLWRSFYLVSNPEKLRDNYHTTRHRAPLVAKRSFPRRPAPDARRRGATNTRERERKERENLTKRIRRFFFGLFFFLFFLKIFSLFFAFSFQSSLFSLSLLSLKRKRQN